MSNQTLKYQLLAELLRSLEVEGFEFGTDKYLQLQDLLGKLPDVPIEELKHIFAPVICTNEKEQILFYTIFDQSLERVKAVHEPIKKIEVTEDESKKWWKWILLLSIPVAIGVIFLLFQTAEEIIEPLPKELNSIFFTVNPDSTRLLCLENLANKEDLEKFARFVESGMGADSTTQKGETTWGKFEIENTTCLKYSAKDSIGKDSIQVFLIDSLGRKTSIFFRANIEKPVIIEEPEQVTSPPVFKTKNHPFPNDIRSLEIQPLSDWENYIRNNAWWLKPLFMLLLASLLWVIIKYLDARRRKLVAEIETQNKAPYVWNIDLEEVENIEMNDTFHSILNKLRQRTTDEFALLDIPKTVESTIQKAGMADFKYRQLTRPPEYLLLIDQHSEANHRAHLFDFLYRAFKENEIHVERFFYNGDPRLCYNEAYPDGISLNDLQHRYYNARLLLLGSGYGLLSAMSGKLLKWTNIFNQWKQRSLLSPRPSEAWGRKESRLQETFHVLPASLQGIQFLIEELDAGEDADFSEWKTKVKDAPQEVIELEEQLIPSLRFYFPEKIVQWIAACAVYPSLHWDLTLHIGNLLSKPNESLLSIENLMEITRLPWFVEGKIPKEERAALLTYLENSHPDTLQRVRENLHELLKQNHPPEDSVAYQDYRMNIALNEWLLTKDKKRKKELEKEIAKYLEAGIEADFTVIKYLDRERTPLDFIVPNAWKKYVHKAGHVGLGMKDIWKDIFYWALPIWLVLSGMAWNYEIANSCNESITIEVNKEVINICIDQRWKEIIYEEWLTHKAINSKKYNEAKSLHEGIISFTVGKVGYLPPLSIIDSFILNSAENDSLALVYKALRGASLNIATHFYNDACVLGNDFFQYSELGDENQIKKDSACILFQEAFFISSAIPEEQLVFEINKGRQLMCEDIVGGEIEVNFETIVDNCCAPCEMVFANISNNATEYLWDFGDGNSSTDKNPTHIYQRAGTYNVKLTASNSENSQFKIVSIKVCDDTNSTPCAQRGGDKDGDNICADVDCNDNETSEAASTDTDGDGVCDDEDLCYLEAGPRSNYGCPIKFASTLIQEAINREGSIQKLYDKTYNFTILKFGINETNIPDSAKAELNALATLLKQNTNLTIELGIFQGLNEQNTAQLTRERLTSIKTFLVNQEVNQEQIKMRPLATMNVNEFTPQIKILDVSKIKTLFTDPRDGQTYPYITIGTQTWMAKNLNYTTPNSWCYLELPELCTKAGRLYTWEAAKSACPSGWHLPSDEEWGTLLKNYDGEGQRSFQVLIEGGKGRFAILFGGYRDRNGEFNEIGNKGYYWSATDDVTALAWGYYFDNANGRVNRLEISKKDAIFCRCIKN